MYTKTSDFLRISVFYILWTAAPPNRSSRCRKKAKEDNVINADQYDHRNFSIYTFENGETKPVFEFADSNFRSIHYSQNDKKFWFYDEDWNEDKEMRMYYLDEDGNRDAMVNPATGTTYQTKHIKPLEGEDSYNNILQVLEIQSELCV